jgi:hypothetical protein
VYVLGVVLVLGGLGHSAGVVRLYALDGVPDANRMLLDVWIAESQLLAGGLYFVASRTPGRSMPCTLSALAALIVMSWAVPVLPVIFARAPIYFVIPPLVYLAASVWVLVWIGMMRDHCSEPR